MQRFSVSHKYRLDNTYTNSIFYAENFHNEFYDEQAQIIRRNNSLQNIPALEYTPLKKYSTMTPDILLFKGYVRKRDEQINSSKKSKDHTWHTFWGEMTRTTFSFYRVKYLLSSVCDEQPLPTQHPPKNSLLLDSLIIIDDCKAERTPAEISVNKLALDEHVLTLARSNGLLCFISTRNEENLKLLLDCINGNSGNSFDLFTPGASSQSKQLSIDPEIDDLLSMIFERKLLLEKLDEMKLRFSGTHHDMQSFITYNSSEECNDSQATLTLVCPFILRLNKPYFMVPGINSTLVTCDDKIKVFGLMEDGRCRCQVLKEAILNDYLIESDNSPQTESNTPVDDLAQAPVNDTQTTFPIIGSIPLSLIATSHILNDTEQTIL